jgi:hypothetical protein
VQLVVLGARPHTRETSYDPPCQFAPKHPLLNGCSGFEKGVGNEFEIQQVTMDVNQLLFRSF